VDIEGNHIDRCRLHGLWARNVTLCRIRGNRITLCGVGIDLLFAIDLESIRVLTLSGNHVLYQRQSPSKEAYRSSAGGSRDGGWVTIPYGAIWVVDVLGEIGCHDNEVVTLGVGCGLVLGNYADEENVFLPLPKPLMAVPDNWIIPDLEYSAPSLKGNRFQACNVDRDVDGFFIQNVTDLSFSDNYAKAPGHLARVRIENVTGRSVVNGNCIDALEVKDVTLGVITGNATANEIVLYNSPVVCELNVDEES
jgi:hypothetical protein